MTRALPAALAAILLGCAAAPTAPVVPIEARPLPAAATRPNDGAPPPPARVVASRPQKVCNAERDAAEAAGARGLDALSRCEERNRSLVDALRSGQRALELAIRERDGELTKASRVRVRELLDRMPHVTFVVPAGADVRSVLFDGRPVPPEVLGKHFSVDPGDHLVEAEGLVSGRVARYSADVRTEEGATAVVRLEIR